MTFWIAAAVLTFVAVLFVLLPLARTRAGIIDPVEYDKAMFVARKQEIEHDLELGRISEDAARAAVAEESRKLIARAEGAKPVPAAAPARAGRAVAIAAVLSVPVLALGAYLATGSPGMPDQRLAGRMAQDPETQSIEQLVSRAESHLATNPQDARGWMVLAPVYQRLGRSREAVQAWANVLRLAPETPEVRASFAEAIVAAADGVVTAEAQRLFEQELVVDPASAKARFYLAIAMAQEGNHARAVEAWDELIATGTELSPWMATARTFRAESALLAGVEADAPVSRGPTQEQIEDAQAMSAEDRQAMIAGMVEGLAARLADDPSDKEGWKRLVRAYTVMGDEASLRNAVGDAIAAHSTDAAFVGEMEAVLAAINAQPPGQGEDAPRTEGSRTQ